MAGLDSQGLTIKHASEIETNLLNQEQQNIDANITAEEDEFLGQLNAILAAAYGELWELTEAVNDNFNVDKAEGKALDDLAANNGLRRDVGVKSSGTQRLIAEPDTVIPENAVFRNPITKDKFFLVGETTVSNTNCISAKYSVRQLLDSNDYIISVNGNSYQYTSDYDATELEILNGLKALIDADVDKTWAATVDTVNLQIIITTSDANNLAILSTAYIGPDEITYDAIAEAENIGPLIVPANSVIELVTFVSGLISTTNPNAYTVGRNKETDEELRLRIKTSQQVLGKGTVEAIQDQLNNITGVTSAQVIENDTDAIDANGRPPHSFESVVLGGADLDIGSAIWTSKGAGIATFGNTSTLITDSQGVERTINFTRPTVINIAIRITYSLYNEEIFPSDGEDTIANLALAYTQSLGLSVDVIPKRYYGDIYDGVPGIDELTVEIQQIVNPGDTPNGGSWQETKLAIDFDEISSTTLTDIYIVAA